LRSLNCGQQNKGIFLEVDTSVGKVNVIKCTHEQGGKAWIQMDKKTHTNPLTEQEIEELRNNPYTEYVTAATVRFTEGFKQLAYEQRTRGIPVSETMRKCGIDPAMLGYHRVEGFRRSLNKKAMIGSGFTDGRKNNYRRPRKTGGETVDERIRQLENELAYTRQEVEFLKKLQAANMEAQRLWESRHRQK